MFLEEVLQLHLLLQLQVQHQLQYLEVRLQLRPQRLQQPAVDLDHFQLREHLLPVKVLHSVEHQLRQQRLHHLPKQEVLEQLPRLGALPHLEPPHLQRHLVLVGHLLSVQDLHLELHLPLEEVPHLEVQQHLPTQVEDLCLEAGPRTHQHLEAWLVPQVELLGLLLSKVVQLLVLQVLAGILLNLHQGPGSGPAVEASPPRRHHPFRLGVDQEKV
jgi:hypothetical protein